VYKRVELKQAKIFITHGMISGTKTPQGYPGICGSRPIQKIQLCMSLSLSLYAFFFSLVLIYQYQLLPGDTYLVMDHS